jgi:hypothetical protein
MISVAVEPVHGRPRSSTAFPAAALDELAVVPGTSHGLLHEKPALRHWITVHFLTSDPVPTRAPLRRASR